jgi:2,3-bisphosphoglycerate-independent phosphoglycerate mutase
VAEVVSLSKYDLVIMNFAPPDMVGHTGLYDAALLGVEATDTGIGIIFNACNNAGYTLFVTADHGNAEKMINLETGEPHTAHTTSKGMSKLDKVPFIMANNNFDFIQSEDAALCDVAPTVLEVMGIEIPAEMTGRSLLKK